MSSLLKQRTKKGKPQDGKQWLHPADLLTDAAVVYPVKLLGVTEVSQAKGTEVIKDAITKVQFAKHIKQSEAGKKGGKLRKVDLKISIHAIKVDDTKTKEEVYSYPLHHISYCADDKRSRKVFAFIAKDKTCPQHMCHVFECEKQAEELTLTVGQAFDLAYRRYLENVGRQKLKAAEAEKDGMKQKLSELEKSQESTTSESSANNKNASLFAMPIQDPPANSKQDVNLWDDNVATVPGIPPPPKHTRQEAKANMEIFDPFESTAPTANGDSSPQMPFDQQPVAPNTISSPFDNSPTPSPVNKVANPFDQIFAQSPSTVPSSAFEESFDPLDTVPSTQSNQPFESNQVSSPFDSLQMAPFDSVQAAPFDSVQKAPFETSPQAPLKTDDLSSLDSPANNNNIYAQPHAQRPRPAPRTNVISSLPPPPSKQSVKAAKAAAAAASSKQESPPLPISNPVEPPNQPSTDLLSMDTRPISPGNPFARPAGFDPFADSFDPLASNPTTVNNQITDLQSDFSKGMILDNNDLLS